MARAKYGTSKKYTFSEGDKVRFINGEEEAVGIVDSSIFRNKGKEEVVGIKKINSEGHIEHFTIFGANAKDVELII